MSGDFLSPRSSVLSPKLPEGLQQLQRGSRLLSHPVIKMSARAASGTPEEVSLSSFSVTRRRSEDRSVTGRSVSPQKSGRSVSPRTPQVSDRLNPAAGSKINKSSNKPAIDKTSETSAPARKSTDAGAGMER